MFLSLFWNIHDICCNNWLNSICICWLYIYLEPKCVIKHKDETSYIVDLCHVCIVQCKLFNKIVREGRKRWSFVSFCFANNRRDVRFSFKRQVYKIIVTVQILQHRTTKDKREIVCRAKKHTPTPTYTHTQTYIPFENKP